MAVAVLEVATKWVCPNCDLVNYTTEQRPHSRMHVCAGLRMLTCPMVPAGTKAKVVAHDREDYVGKNSIPQVDGNGRPVMSITVTRDDGEDCYVLAPTAVARVS